MKKIAVILAGCGHRDGTEIHEASITMLTLELEGAKLECVSIDKDQTAVVNHLNGEKVNETRSLLREAARIARGKIKPISQISADEIDGVVIPGGFGAALNLCDYATKGINDMSVDKELESFLIKVYEQKKPIGAICIAPVILAKVFAKYQPKITLGTDKNIAAQITQINAVHVDCLSDDCVVDEKNLFVTTPAFMVAQNIKDIYPGINKLSRKILNLSKK